MGTKAAWIILATIAFTVPSAQALFEIPPAVASASLAGQGWSTFEIRGDGSDIFLRVETNATSLHVLRIDLYRSDGTLAASFEAPSSTTRPDLSANTPAAQEHARMGEIAGDGAGSENGAGFAPCARYFESGLGFDTRSGTESSNIGIMLDGACLGSAPYTAALASGGTDVTASTFTVGSTGSPSVGPTRSGSDVTFVPAGGFGAAGADATAETAWIGATTGGSVRLDLSSRWMGSFGRDAVAGQPFPAATSHATDPEGSTHDCACFYSREMPGAWTFAMDAGVHAEDAYLFVAPIG